MTGNTNTAADFRSTILNGDSVELMRQMPRNAVDFILTDPPYLVNYQGRDGRKVVMTIMHAGSVRRSTRCTVC